MTQSQHFIIGDATYPLATGTNKSLLFDTDNTTYRLLEFYSNILQLNLGARWAQDAAAAGLVQANFPNIKDGYIVGSKIAYPPSPTLMSTSYIFPLLSVYRISEKNVQWTTMKIQNVSQYRITLVLPPLSSADMYNSLYPYLKAASDTISYYNFVGSDPKFNNGELVFKEANIDFATTIGTDFGSYLTADEKTFYPSLMMKMEVHEGNHFYQDDYIELTGIDGYLGVQSIDGYAEYETPSFVSFYQDFNFGIYSISQTTGSVGGGTLIVLVGSGFSTAQLSQNIQITVAGQPVISFKVANDKLIYLTTAGVAAPTSGPVAITSNAFTQSGNPLVATSTQVFTYAGQ